ncbi:hypothetical protein CYMTET_41495 [Cymbomonas tetramitiformis]|uniref:CCHC-type domain-containing protein n=1 Tax=Cymbomonas tetramitiformis TaxID=36881 RepID=A0AAE0C7B1_9CHLO|nr:hypothetical protein CYMTET_41495 [Cymbomonas tetramitiformis]
MPRSVGPAWGGGRAGAAPGSAVGSGRSGSRAAGLSVGPGSGEFWGAAGGSDSRDWRSRERRGGVRRALARQYGGEALEVTPARTPLRAPPGLSGGPPRASPPKAPSPARVSGAEPVSELALSSALRQPARRKRASPEAPAPPAAGAGSGSDSDRSAKGLNPSAAPFSPLPASSRSASSRVVRREPTSGPAASSLSSLVGSEQGNLISAPGRFEVYRASDWSPPAEGESDDVRRPERLDVVQSRGRESRIQPNPAWRGERRQSMLALALRQWSTWARNSAQRRARVSLPSRQRATARLAWVAWRARTDQSAHQRELQCLAFQAWNDVTQQVAQLQGLFDKGSRRRVESAFAAWRQHVVQTQGLWRRGRRQAGAVFMAWHQQTMLAKERSTWWVGARRHRMTQMGRRCLREWRRLPRTTPVSSDSSQGTSARRPVRKAGTSSGVSSCSDSDQKSMWQDIRRGLKRLGKDHPLSGLMWFQLEDYGLSEDGAYRLEIPQQSVSESRVLMQQKREDPHNSLGRCRFSVFAINAGRPGELVRQGADLQEVRRAVVAAVRMSGRTRKSHRGLRKSGAAPPSSAAPGGNWPNRFAPLSSSSEEEHPAERPRPRTQAPKPSGPSRPVPRTRKPGRAPSAPHPGPTSSGNTSSSPESTSSRNSQDLQELKEAWQKESQAREAAAEARLEQLSRQLQESQRAAEERRISDQRAAEERRDSERRAVEERWAADRLAAEARETARQVAVDESVAQQVAAEERRAAAEAQLEERLQAVIESQVQRLALVQASPPGPVESDARGPSAAASSPVQATPISREGHELVEPTSVVTCDVENRDVQSPPEESRADVTASPPHSWDFISLPIQVCDALRKHVVGYANSGIDAQRLFYDAARRYRALGQVAGCLHPSNQIRQCLKAKFSDENRVLGAQVIHSLTTALASVAESCARCGCGHEESPVRMWACQASAKRSVVAFMKKVYLPVCGFCAADVWPGAFDHFPAVMPPPIPKAADTPGDGGGMVPQLEHSEPNELSEMPGASSHGGPGGSGSGDPGGPGGPGSPDEDPGGDGEDGDGDSQFTFSSSSRYREPRSHYSHKDEQHALKEATRAMEKAVDKYHTEVEGSSHVFGRLLRFVRQVREVRELEPVRYAMEMARLGPLESGGEEKVLSDHSLLSEVARHCFGKLSSEYRELSSVLTEAREGKNLTLDVIVVPLAQLVMPDKGEMASIGPFLRRVRQSQDRQTRTVREFWDGVHLAHDIVSMLAAHELTSPVPEEGLLEIFLTGLIPEIRRKVFLIAERKGASVLTLSRTASKGRHELLTWAIEAERELRQSQDKTSRSVQLLAHVDVTEELLAMATSAGAPTPTGQRLGSPEYEGCRLCKSMDHYARDCPQASQRPKEWAKCLLEDTLALIGDESVEEALAAIGLDFVQEDAPQPGASSPR